MTSHYKNFPQINELINQKQFLKYPKYLTTHLAKSLISKLKSSATVPSKQEIIDALEQSLLSYQDLTWLINATGVVMHTNLGRSLIDEDIYDNARKLVCSYSNLEFDLSTGKRGDRYEVLARHICMLLGCEDALVVNNNAAAVYLVLNTFANGAYAITSRSELVEIGGSFRVSEVMKNSGAKLYEVGTSNKTHLKDYTNALDELASERKIIVKTHKSNFYQEGFVSEIDATQLQKLCDERGVDMYYDLGGASVDGMLGELGLKQLVKSGVGLISFSGDKLFSSVQSGIIIGKKHYIDALKQNQMLRMLRISKLEISMLNESVKKYLRGELPLSLSMIKDDADMIHQKALSVYDRLDSRAKSLSAVVPTSTLAGAGAIPSAKFDSYAICIERGDVKAIADEFARNKIIGKLINKKFYIDFKSIKLGECEYVANIVQMVLDNLQNN